MRIHSSKRKLRLTKLTSSNKVKSYYRLQQNQMLLDYLQLVTKKKDTLKDVIAENQTVKRNTVSVINKVLTVQTFASVKNVKMWRVINLAHSNTCSKLLRRLKTIKDLYLKANSIFMSIKTRQTFKLKTFQRKRRHFSLQQLKMTDS